jgi:DNA mismatch repair protein MutS
LETKHKTGKKAKLTPLMAQYFSIKKKHPDAILLFRVGDFYETFSEDAIKVSEVLGIILTNRNNGGSKIELAGFPYHSLSQYLPRLVKAGFRVAICEQLEKPSKEKKIVKRGITELITPGVSYDDTLLDQKNNNFLASVFPINIKEYSISFLDASTGEFLVSEGDATLIQHLIQNFQPNEIIYPRSKSEKIEALINADYYLYGLEDWIYTAEFSIDRLKEHFPDDSLKGFGIAEMYNAQIAAGAILHYLDTTENKHNVHINKIAKIHIGDYVWLDTFTIRNLELIHSNNHGGTPLINIMDQTKSAMGARLMKRWMLMPLINEKEIKARHLAVEFLMNHSDCFDLLRSTLKNMTDLERLMSKTTSNKVSPREIRQLAESLKAIQPVKGILTDVSSDLLKRAGNRLDSCITLFEKIEQTISEEAPALITKGNSIVDGCNAELDELRNISKNAKDLLLEIQQTEAHNTGIASLKIGFNNVFGYYLEVTNKYKDKGLVPDHWVRKQTLSNAERYITDELKQLEEKILGAQEKMLELEQIIFSQLLTEILEYTQQIQLNATILAELDCLASFAKTALESDYCKPTIDKEKRINIIQGRHPVIEKHLGIGDHYIPNNIELNQDQQQILMITGPNMSGKSAVLRQTALICLMAQMGSFVPAEQAELGIIDKIFTRVGASDNISSGESTFMVEMIETASIMNNLSDRSLILLDEIGRGTSTYDGISIAWSLAEYLHDHPEFRALTLFATHYHELNELAESYPRIKNFNIATKEIGQKVIFLRKLISGGSKHSFGIHVAKMAGMPKEIVSRASNILKQLEQKHIDNSSGSDKDIGTERLPLNDFQTVQLSMFTPEETKGSELINLMEQLDLNTMTPIDCMLKLHELMQFLEASDDA